LLNSHVFPVFQSYYGLCVFSLSIAIDQLDVVCVVLQQADMNSKPPAKKKDDAAFDVEQQFILRLPPVRLF